MFLRPSENVAGRHEMLLGGHDDSGHWAEFTPIQDLKAVILLVSRVQHG